MAAFRTLDDLEQQLGGFRGKRILVRADLNVPMADGRVTDATRIDAVVPTLRRLADAGARVIVLAHFGRPKGGVEPKYSLKPVVPALAEALGQPVGFAPDCTAVPSPEDGGVVLAENTRFHAGEEKNDAALAKAMAQGAQGYVNDAFSCAHRAHASTEGLTHILPSAAGLSMTAELEALEAALGQPTRPVVALVGGAKVSSKLDVLSNLVAKVDALVIGGGMANTFLYAQGVEVGKSLCERDLADTARAILDKAKAANCAIVLPVDAVVAREFKAGAASDVVPVGQVPADAMILDVGPGSVAAVEERFAGSRTLVWNGPLGAFEIAPFDQGTNGAAQAAAKLTRAGSLRSVAGGGDTVAALNHAGAADDFSYISTAGGAFLEWLEGKALPGVEALRSAK
ncbi:phosphoglycerate kinase [Zavarzinia sp. CC-PAN008]|uniref:phosphoglycerate kinase n=1 Tax=Zavarzinia sp. CC-PAN008 TaxID=3243332 RepID=UPI003F745172